VAVPRNAGGSVDDPPQGGARFGFCHGDEVVAPGQWGERGCAARAVVESAKGIAHLNRGEG